MQQHDLIAILASVRRLDSLLTEEFDALKNQKLDVFEALQTEKIDILESLAKLDLSEEKMERETLQRLINDPTWNEITAILERCKRSHQRNELLISKQLDSIRGALSALQNQDPTATLELYTKLGKTRATRRSILSGDA
ncbi:flagellar export chaperone FlgN [Litorivicinus sp.]|jgi:flagellar biosynthesis/type III secretory pathway chaperone|nr:flagellar export chaperone FlgN [Litorivicinus sp.]MDC1088059.1 flagellar export chaperone FlgN [Litorivicinus sp.]